MKHLIKLTKRLELLDFLDVCLDRSTPHDLEKLCMDVFTEHELVSITERWTIAKLLHMGFSYRTIMEKTGASTSTIARMSRLLMNGTGGLRSACQRREGKVLEDDADIPPYTVLCAAFQ